ncbi:OmpA family protein [Crocinitomix catalasitica]|uniref:OmpA family protein n=1 Tax=Crocinitomix catalasitica TaxID=184607 RepID=UPI00146FC112|nr:OmpA family protein [Crocinitomix catalasitica]
MKKLLLIIFIISSAVYAQESNPGKLKKANYLFENFSYDEAIKRFENIELTTLDDKRKLGISYWNTGELNKAEAVFRDVVLTEGNIADDLYNYAAILKEVKNYDDADLWMKAFAERKLDDSRGVEFTENVDVRTKIQEDNGQFSIENLEMNSEAQDFGVSFYKNKLVYASTNTQIGPIYRRWNWNKLPFLDMYIAEKEGNQIKSPIKFDSRFNKKFHEGPVCFNSDGTFMIFTRNNYNEKDADGMTRLMLMSSKFVDDEWTDPIELPFNSKDHSCGHATMSKDGKWLFFVSDMVGGIGGADIYKVQMNEDGTYGQPINLGATINTEGNEVFPFIHAGNEMLLFSSDGKFGLGGLDVFVAQLKDEYEIGKVMNIGAPINSSLDDFALIIDADQKSGYLSSNRIEGKGDDDIYSVTMNAPFMFGKTIKGIAKDKKGEILAGVEVVLKDAEGAVAGTATSKEDGSYQFLVDGDKQFTLNGVKEKYFAGSNTANTETIDDIIIADLELEKDPGLSIYALITGKASKMPLDSVRMRITDNMTGKVEEYLTDQKGDYFKALANKKLNDRGSYNIEIERDGYLSKTVTYNTLFDKEGKYEVHSELDLSLEKIELGGDLSKIIDIKPIYFDLGRYKIRPDAATELDKIVKVMNENPKMEVELGSHTDARGSARSNESLSDKRAKASAQYVKERISNPDRIYGKGFGETKLVNECGDGVKCSEEKHQENRRTEFIIVKL